MTKQEIEALQIGDVISYQGNKKEKIQYIILFINRFDKLITLKRLQLNAAEVANFKFNYSILLLTNVVWQLKIHPINVLMSLLEEK